MAKRQLYYRVDIRDVERVLGELLAKRADLHYAILAGALDWLGVTPDFDKVRAFAQRRDLPSLAGLEAALLISEIIETETEVS